MKRLRDKETGQVFETIQPVLGGDGMSIAELSEKWEDVPEEPKGKALYWMILTLENFIENEPDDKWVDLEDCKQMLEKLKAWKRLKDRHFKFDDYDILNQTATWLVSREYDQYENDIKLLFGGEE